MEPAEYKNIFEQEEHHFFYRSTHSIVETLFRCFLHTLDLTETRRISILDAGCGTGYLSLKLAPFGHVTAVDISEEAIAFAKKRGVKAERASISDLPFDAGTFDVIVSIDVLYHNAVKDDGKALCELRRVLKPGGLLIMRVPAHRWLFGAHDRFVHGRTRYEKKELKEKLLEAGFDVLVLSYTHALLYPLAMARKIWETVFPHRSPSSRISHVPRIANSFLTAVLSWETILIKTTGLPFGIGLITLCRKNR